MAENDVRKTIDAIPRQSFLDFRDRAILETLFSTGLRVSELVSLARMEYDALDASKNGTKELSILGKGEYRRVVFFSPRAVLALSEYLKQRNDGDARLFPCDKRTVQYMVERRGISAGIPFKLTPHMFRHSYATNLLKKGVNLFDVKGFLGHRNISSTEKYLHTSNLELLTIHEKIYGKK